MNIQLDKKNGINLKKGTTISLVKDDYVLQDIKFGINWGAIPRTGIFSSVLPGVKVDLDASVALFSGKKALLDVVSYRRLRSSDRSVIHSGDDLDGDLFGDDGKDNETIKVFLEQLSPKVTELIFFLNSFKQQDFSIIPYTKIRIYEQKNKYENKTLATYNISAGEMYKGFVSMVMGKMYRGVDGIWKFKTLGVPVPTKNLDQTVSYIQKRMVGRY